MSMLPITLCLFTSSKGHFGVKTRYLETLESLQSQLMLDNFNDLVAHIKISPGEEQIGKEMEAKLTGFGFRVASTVAPWAHSSDSHQHEYLKDMLTVYNNSGINTPYVLHLEDDFVFRCYSDSLLDYIESSINILKSFSDIMQVRFARFSNEKERIVGLMKKHGIDGRVKDAGAGFYHNDYSQNPCIFRTRDIRAAVITTIKTNVPKHVEHGTGMILKLFSMADLPFFSFSTDRIRVGHIGCLPGEEDKLDQPLNSD